MPTTTLKGLNASIFRDEDKLYGGLFDHVSRITVLECPGGAIHEATPNSPAAKFVVRMMGGKRLVHIIPLLTDEQVKQTKGKVGPMFGGTFAYSSDSRFSEATGLYAAIPIHDLWLTTDEYNRSTI